MSFIEPPQVWFLLSKYVDGYVNFHANHYEKSQNWVVNANSWSYDLLSITKFPKVWVKLSDHVVENINICS